ncbi:MAG: PEGA domain-containing protein [Pseudomonadota bacterium]
MSENQHESIRAEAFEPSLGEANRDRLVRNAILGGSFAVLFIIAFTAWYLFTGQSVQVVVVPEPTELELRGGLLRVQFSDRWLLRPGDYSVSASLEGYRPLEEAFVVDVGADQRFEFALEKLPGIVDVAVDPAEISVVRVEGEVVGAAPITGLELKEGQYGLQLEAPRYQPREEVIDIEGGGVTQSFSFELVPDWAEVTVTSTPPGATLSVDGEPVGETPVTVEVLSGDHSLELRLDRYKPWDTALSVEALVPQTLAPVRLEPADHLLRVVSVPSGASVTIDGEFQGQAPMTVPLRPDESYRVSLSLPGYRPNTRVVDVLEGDDTRLSVRLQPILGTVIVRGGPTDAEVYVDGSLRGIVDEPIELPAHPHRVEVRREGFETFRTSVTPNPQVEQVINVAMTSDEERRRARTPAVLDTVVGAQLKLFRPSGIFRMGSARREQGRRSNEFLRQVQLERPFYLGINEVTNEQFKQFRAEHDSGVVERETLALDRQPVVRVSWQDAARFCNWLSEREGLPAAYKEVNGTLVPVSPMTTGFRLPTETEWVLAARYGGASEGRAALRFGWGADLPPPQGAANVAGREAGAVVETPLTNYQDAYAATAQVGQLAPSPSGLYDLAGNVAEWMHDFYTIRVADPPGTVDPLGPESGETHVLRGASWRSASISELRFAWRGDGTAGRDDIGFRLARYAE